MWKTIFKNALMIWSLIIFSSACLLLIVLPPSDYFHNNGWGYNGKIEYESYCTSQHGDVISGYREVSCFGVFDSYERLIQYALTPLDLLFFPFSLGLLMAILGFWFLSQVTKRIAESKNIKLKGHFGSVFWFIFIIAIVVGVLYLINFVSDATKVGRVPDMYYLVN